MCGGLQVFQVADRIAAAGFTVAVPNVLQEAGPWPMSDFPPSDGAKFMAWVNSLETPAVVAKVKAAQKHIEARGVASFGVVGFCWGSMISLYMARAAPSFSCVLAAHEVLTCAAPLMAHPCHVIKTSTSSVFCRLGA